MPLNYMITSKWVDQTPQWYSKLEVNVRNNTSQDITSPKIGFDISNGDAISSASAHTGFEPTNFSAPMNHIEGHLAGHLSKLVSHSSTTITFGFNLNSLPSQFPTIDTFTFNDDPIVIPDDHTSPTPVKDITTTSSGPTGFSLNWTPSIDEDTGVDKYVVKYKATHETTYYEATTSTNSISLKNLTANTNYQVNITAVDYAGNASPSISYDAYTDEVLKGPARWQESNWIKGSPYVDSTAWPTPPIDTWYKETDVQGYFLGFITATVDKNSGTVKACWGGNTSVYDGNDNQTYEGDVTVSDYYKSYINNIRTNGGDIILSFGGASNEPIERSTTDIKQIVDIYLKAITNYGLTAIDFDFEGGFLGNIEALDRHIAAITEVIKANPQLKISYTLPVDGAPGLMGFNTNGITFLTKLHDAGITPSLINVMSMEFGQGSSTNLFECARLSLEGDIANDKDGSKKGAIKQIKEIWNDLSTEQIYKMTGLCTMYGKHLNGKVNTINAQQKINEYFVGSKGLGNVSGWDASIDMDPQKGGGGYNAGDYGRVVAAYEPDLLGNAEYVE